jgi:ATP-dependent DNA helicase 2 subunit 1
VLRTTGDATATQQLDRILQFATLGLERIPLSPADVLQIKKVSHNFCDSACIIVHGFQPLCELSVAHFLDTSYILYPTDLKHQGSVEACTNLVAAMLETQVYAVAQLLVRTTAIPRLCALVPQDDLTLVMTMLPYQDDLRQVEPEARAVEVSSELVEKAVDLIEHQRLQNVEIGVNFVNASIEKFWSYIEAVALETSLPEPEQYEVELNEEEVLKAAGPQIDAFRDALPEDVPTKKSSSSSSSRSTQPRKRKALVVDESGQDWRYLYTTGSIDSCSMDDLKSYLRSVGARVGGKKDDLVRRVRQSILERIEKDGF